MAHLIETIRDLPIREATRRLGAVHRVIVKQAVATRTEVAMPLAGWGSALKRLDVVFPKSHPLLGKSRERFIEVINIVATVERTLASLRWFARIYPELHVQECHASTSDAVGGNDIVLVEANTAVVRVRCEVTDVVSSDPDQNGKEKDDLRKLGCHKLLPSDGVVRYIATSSEFAKALSSPTRRWKTKHFRYVIHKVCNRSGTIALEICSPH